MRRVFIVEVTDEELDSDTIIRARAQEFMGNGRVYQIKRRDNPDPLLRTAPKPILMEDAAVGALVGLLRVRDIGQESKEERDGGRRGD